jgi:hypothetical protein
LDWFLSRASITARVLVLRIFAAVLSIVLLYFGATALCRTLQLPEQFANAALFTIFCSEMLYATVAHVANDWLAVGLSALFLAALAEVVREPNRRCAWSAAGFLAAGLLTKAYFLVFCLLALAAGATLIGQRRIRPRTVLAGAVLVLSLAAPWYIRNLALYGNLSGTYEQFDGIGIPQAVAAASRINWPSTIAFLARGSVWTGNSSFTTFSRSTLDIVLALVFLGIAAWGLRRHAVQPAERIVFAAIVLFSLAVAYASCASFADNKGGVPGASPWYTQVLLTPVMALAYLGMSRWQTFGPVLAGCSTVIWSWVLIATWAVKLFPMYSGNGAAPMRLNDIWNWYKQGAVARASDLSLLALAPAPWLYIGMLLSLTLTVIVSALTIRDLTLSLKS